MRIALYHGYELTGSGSNEYNRYLSRALARLGHEVHILCREPHPEAIDHIGRAFESDGTEIFERTVDQGCSLHRLPTGEVIPVYLTDKQRKGKVKAFPAMSDAELEAYHLLEVAALRSILGRHPVDLLHANHLVYQPIAAAGTDTPFIVFPHGSSLEYTLRTDPRLKRKALEALRRAAGIVSGSSEMLARIQQLFAGESFAAEIVGVGVDTDLFRPCGTEGLQEIRGPFGGKRPEQSAQLRASLDRGEYEAVGADHESYDHGQPDTDLVEKLGRIPWGSGRVLLFVGALTAGKGLHNLIDALQDLPDAHLVVVGSGAYREVLEALVHAIATGNQELFDHLCAHGFDLDRSKLAGGWTSIGGVVRESPLADRVHFLGRLDHERLRRIYPCADLAVFPSVVPEAYPLVLMEAISNGVLPAVSDFSGFRDGLNTLEPLLGKELVDRMRLPMDPAGIARRLNALLDAKRVEGLHEIAVHHFDWSVVARQMVEAYQRLLARSGDGKTLASG